MKTKTIISIVTSCTLLCTAAMSVHAVEQEKSVQETPVVTADFTENSAYAEQVAILVNKERAANGLQPVKFSLQLSEAATVRSLELKEKFSHTRPDGTSCFTAMEELGISYRAAAENIAYGQKSPESVMNAWMNSDGHRANILSRNMEYIGVGVVNRDGTYYWTQLFALSDSLSDGAYLPGEESVPPAVTSTLTTTTAPQTTLSSVKPTTTQTTAAEPPVTTMQTTATETVTTEQPAATETKPVTSNETVHTTVTESTTTTVCQTTTAEAVTTKPLETDCVDIITKPVIFGDSSVIGGGAIVIISPK